MGWNVAGNIRGPQGPQGNPGPQGDPGPVGPAGLQWQGAWAAATQYAANDSVAWGGTTYFALDDPLPVAGTPPTGTQADPGEDDLALNAGWAVLAVEGAQGPAGPQGNPGPQGDPGAPGTTGTRGSQWFVGTGAPGVIAGALPNDQYLDQDTGDVYTLT